MSLQLRVVSHSEVGLVRKNNQDSGYASPRLLVVADGMGGAAAGDLASAVAIQTIRTIDTPLGEEDAPSGTDSSDTDGTDTDGTHTDGADTDGADTDGTDTTAPPISAAFPTSGPVMLDRLSEAIHRANTRIAELIDADYSLEGMGTTVTGALFDGTQLGLAHIGDSRAYLLRDGRLERLTHDHSWVQSLIDDGKISETEAAVHPHRSLLLKVLNGQPANDPDLTTVRVQAGDRLLFCSDGICGLLDDADIAETMRIPDLAQALAELVDRALAEGGIDNITAILADVVEAGAAAGVVDDSGAAVVLGAAAERDAAAPGAATSSATEDTLISRRDVPTETATGAAVRSSPRAPADHEDEARYNPRAPAKRRLLRTLAVALGVLLVAGAGLAAGYAWTRSQFYVGASGGQVAIYQGLPDGLPGIPLSRVYEVQPLALSALPPYYQAQVGSGIEVASLDAARQTVAELTATAKRCAEQRPAPKPTPSPSGKPSGSATPRSSPTAKRPTPNRPTPIRPTPTGSRQTGSTQGPSRTPATPVSSPTTPGPGSEC